MTDSDDLTQHYSVSSLSLRGGHSQGFGGDEAHGLMPSGEAIHGPTQAHHDPYPSRHLRLPSTTIVSLGCADTDCQLAKAGSLKTAVIAPCLRHLLEGFGFKKGFIQRVTPTEPKMPGIEDQCY